MTKKKTRLPVSVPGANLAPAWLNAFLATGDDEDRPVLYRTILVEVYSTGIQVIATDSFMLLGAFAPTATDDLVRPPSIDEAPTASYVVHDPDRRAAALMRYILAESTAAEKAGRPYEVTLNVATLEDPAAPTLDPTLDRAGFVLSIETERLALPIYEGEYPNWRQLLSGSKNDPTARVALSPTLLGRFGALKGMGASHIRMDFAGPDGLIGLSSPGHEGYLFGALMPIRED